MALKDTFLKVYLYIKNTSITTKIIIVVISIILFTSFVWIVTIIGLITIYLIGKSQHKKAMRKSDLGVDTEIMLWNFKFLKDNIEHTTYKKHICYKVHRRNDR